MLAIMVFGVVGASYLLWQTVQEQRRDPPNAAKTGIMGLGAVTSLLTYVVVASDSMNRTPAKKD